MSRTLKVEIAGKEYAFGLNRKEIVRGEKIGLRLKNTEDMPGTQMVLFWKVGIHQHHSNLNDSQCEELLDQFVAEGGNLSSVVQFLSEEYAAFFSPTQTDTKPEKPLKIEEN